MQELEMVFGNKSKQFCLDCEYCIENEDKSLCELDHWTEIPNNKAKLYIAILFDCVEYVKRK